MVIYVYNLKLKNKKCITLNKVNILKIKIEIVRSVVNEPLTHLKIICACSSWCEWYKT